VTRTGMLTRAATTTFAGMRRARPSVAACARVVMPHLRRGGRFNSTATPKAQSSVPPTAAVPPPAQSPIARFGAWYESCLESSPILTKMVTSGILFSCGDVLGQSIMRARAPPGEEPPAFDWGRLTRATLFGGIFYPPVAHVHYNFLEWIVVTRWAVSVTMMPWAKMFLEQFVYWGYFSNAYYHAVLGALQGMGPDQIYHRVADTLWDTMKAQWAFWIPVQLLNFKFVPVRHQLNVVLVVSLFWTTFLSIAFPPAKVAEDKEGTKAT